MLSEALRTGALSNRDAVCDEDRDQGEGREKSEPRGKVRGEVAVRVGMMRMKMIQFPGKKGRRKGFLGRGRRLQHVLLELLFPVVLWPPWAQCASPGLLL